MINTKVSEIPGKTYSPKSLKLSLVPKNFYRKAMWRTICIYIIGEIIHPNVAMPRFGTSATITKERDIWKIYKITTTNVDRPGEITLPMTY